VITLIKDVLKLVILWLNLKNKAFAHNLVRMSQAKRRDLVNEIEKNRTIGTNDSSDRADLLRAELVAESRHLKHLSAFYLEAGGEDTDTDG